MGKELFDPRGRQSSIFRVAAFDMEALAHMLSYRILVFLGPIAAIVIATGFISGNSVIMADARVLLLAVWVLFTPQIYAASRAFSVARTNGASSGYLNEFFVESRVKKDFAFSAYKALPYLVVAAWGIGFVIAFLGWIL